jgi:dephospho-CoA kinase
LFCGGQVRRQWDHVRVLIVALTGGIGAGKSTVAQDLRGFGAVVIDADESARWVVRPGSSGLAEVVQVFGPTVLDGRGDLDRAALAQTVFSDATARMRLEAVIHPLVRAHMQELTERARERGARLVVHDIPLLVESRLDLDYPLVVTVEADEDVRIRRLERRGLPVGQSQARMATQAIAEFRMSTADVVIDNNGDEAHLARVVHDLWAERLGPFAENIAHHAGARMEGPVLSEWHRGWKDEASRALARIRHRLGPDVSLHHIGSTSVVGLAAKDVIDLQVGVSDDSAIPSALSALDPDLGYVRSEDELVPDESYGPGGLSVKGLLRSADPGRRAHVHIRPVGGQAWRFNLLLRDYLRANDEDRFVYEDEKRRLADLHPGSTQDYADAKTHFMATIHPRMEEWAELTGWKSEAVPSDAAQLVAGAGGPVVSPGT